MITIDVGRWWRWSSSRNWGPACVYISWKRENSQRINWLEVNFHTKNLDELNQEMLLEHLNAKLHSSHSDTIIQWDELIPIQWGGSKESKTTLMLKIKIITISPQTSIRCHSIISEIDSKGDSGQGNWAFFSHRVIQLMQSNRLIIASQPWRIFLFD